MEKESSNQGFFREAFNNFERKPSDRVWNNIEKGINPSFVNKTSFLKSKQFYITGFVITFISLVLFFIIKPENSNQIAVVKTNQSKQQNTESVKPVISNEENKVHELSVHKKDISSEEIKDKNDRVEIHSMIAKTEPDVTLPRQSSVVEKKKILTDENLNSEKSKHDTEIKNYNVKQSNIQEISPVSYTAIAKNNGTEISFTPDQNICKGEKIKIEVKGGVKFLWSTGEKTQFIYVSPLVSTDYSVVVTDDLGNQKTGLISVNVSDCEAVYIPNAFTPNGDGQHDIFKAIGNGVRNFEMIIVSRSGQVVFTSNNIDEGWDGNFKGNPVQMGTYIYSVKYIDEINKPHTINGHVNVIR